MGHVYFLLSHYFESCARILQLFTFIVMNIARPYATGKNSPNFLLATVKKRELRGKQQTYNQDQQSIIDQYNQEIYIPNKRHHYSRQYNHTLQYILSIFAIEFASTDFSYCYFR